MWTNYTEEETPKVQKHVKHAVVGNRDAQAGNSSGAVLLESSVAVQAGRPWARAAGNPAQRRSHPGLWGATLTTLFSVLPCRAKGREGLD